MRVSIEARLGHTIYEGDRTAVKLSGDLQLTPSGPADRQLALGLHDRIEDAIKREVQAIQDEIDDIGGDEA